MVRLNNDRVYVTKVDAQAVVLDASSSTYLTANDTASLIVDELRGGSTLDTLVASMTERFDVSADTARDDCVAFLRELDRRGWLSDAAAGGSTPPPT